MTRQDRERLERFAGGEPPAQPFGHREHVRLAWLYLEREPLLPAMARFAGDLERFAAAQGTPGLYHETITLAYLLLVHERRLSAARDATWEAFAAANPDLFAWKPSLLDELYEPEVLTSERARRSFVLPRATGTP